MANGQTHTLATMIGAGGGVMYYGLDNIPASSAFLLAGLWCVITSPDLDVDDGFHGLTVLNRTKEGLGDLWQAYWKPYSKAIPHRSFFSHFPIISTFIRLVYGGWYFLPLLIKWEGAPMFITCIIAFDTVHWILDWRIWGAVRLFRQ